MSSGHQRRLSHRRGDEEHATIFLCGSFLNQYAPDFFNQLMFLFCSSILSIKYRDGLFKAKLFYQNI